MSNDLVTFGPEGAVDSGGQEGGDSGTQGGDAGGQREQHSRTRAHDEQGRFAGPAPKPKTEPKAKETPPPAPARLKFRVPKEEGEGEEELELTPEEASQRLAEARKLARARDEERAAREKAEKEGAAFRRLTAGLKDGQSRAQLLRGFMRDSGLSAEEAEDALAEALHGELEERSLSPEQRRIRELEEREAQREEEERTRKADAEMEAFTKAARAKEAEYSKVWGEALEKTGLPKTPELLADIARHHILNKKKGLSLTADELANYASARFDAGLGVRLKGVSGEEFAKRFPEAAKAWQERTENMDAEAFLAAHPKMGPKLLKHFREKARARTTPGVGASRPPPRSAQSQASGTPVYYDEWGR